MTSWLTELAFDWLSDQAISWEHRTHGNIEISFSLSTLDQNFDKNHQPITFIKFQEIIWRAVDWCSDMSEPEN